jgi:hypothetical protein
MFLNNVNVTVSIMQYCLKIRILFHLKIRNICQYEMMSENILGEQMVANIQMKIKVLFSLLRAYIYKVWNYKSFHFLVQ